VSRTEQTRDLLQSINKLRIGERKRKGDLVMLWTIVGILFVLWLLGFSLHVGGALIHALLVIAIVVVIVNMLRGRSSV
jgi:fatty acid desaturase